MTMTRLQRAGLVALAVTAVAVAGWGAWAWKCSARTADCKAENLQDEETPSALDQFLMGEGEGISTYTVVSGDSLYKIAARHNTTVEWLKTSNRLPSDVVRLGQQLKVPAVRLEIIVDKATNTLQLLDDRRRVLKTYTVATGKDGITPEGEFKIVNKLPHPTWYTAGAVIPPDSPQNILGTRWLGIDKPGYGIHGTTEPQSIGTQSTAGCVRMLNGEVEELYDLLPLGTRVRVGNSAKGSA